MQTGKNKNGFRRIFRFVSRSKNHQELIGKPLSVCSLYRSQFIGERGGAQRLRVKGW